MMRWFLLLLPWIELFSLISLGGEIGALATLFYVFVTFVLGMTLLRLQGMEVVGKLREAQEGWSIPRQLLVDDLAVGLAALLLIIPGLITDSLAILLVIGPLLRRLFGQKRPKTGSTDGPGSYRSSPGSESNTTIDGEFRRLDDE